MSREKEQLPKDKIGLERLFGSKSIFFKHEMSQTEVGYEEVEEVKHEED